MVRSVVMTSATLATGNDDKFKFFRSRIGLTGGLSIRVGSPFDYQQQAKLVVVSDLPDPSREREEFEKSIPNQIKRFVGHTEGHAFVLFTSYKLLRRVADWIRDPLQEGGMPLLVQGDGVQRTSLLERFRGDRRSVLLGTDRFWHVDDVQGEARV